MEPQTKMAEQTNREHQQTVLLEKPAPWYLNCLFNLLMGLQAIDLVLAITYQGSIPSMRLVIAKEVIMFSFTLVGRATAKDTVTGYNYVKRMYNIGQKLHQVTRKEAKVIIERRNRRMQLCHKIIGRTFLVTYIYMCVIPYIQNMAVMITAHLQGQPPPTLRAIYHIYYPPSLGRSAYVSMLAHTGVSVLYGLSIYYWYLPLKCAMLAGECLMADIRLLGMSLQMKHYEEEGDEELDKQSGKRMGEASFREELNNIVKNHQSLYRDMEELNELFQKVAVGFINFYALQMCLIVFFIVKAPEIEQKIRLSLRYFIAISIMYACSQLGENIREEGKQLRMDIWHCPWVEKPVWVKKTLILMLARSTRDMEFRPYGLYALDIKCVLRVLQGTYTYFNVLKKVGF